MVIISPSGKQIPVSLKKQKVHVDFLKDIVKALKLANTSPNDQIKTRGRPKRQSNENV